VGVTVTSIMQKYFHIGAIIVPYLICEK
jgi:hypothetical protein